MKEVPEALNRIIDTVLAYRPKPKAKKVGKRKTAKHNSRSKPRGS